MYKKITFILIMTLSLVMICSCGKSEDDELTLRVCNWEEYIDEGGWDEDEVIDLPEGDILGETPMIEEFEDWYYKTYGEKIRVEYSAYGSNEELYNQLTLGDEFDLICPSDYMTMKLIDEDKLLKFSDDFFDPSIKENYYAKGVSPYIDKLIKKTKIKGVSIADYTAGYMWGVTGNVYNPEEIDESEVKTWKLLVNPKYEHRVTMKDNVRDAYFVGLSILKSDELLKFADDYKNGKITLEEYQRLISLAVNDTDRDSIKDVEDLLQNYNFYSYENDNGKFDMFTGKVLVNFQWSGDGVYTLDQADEDDYYLKFAVPDECSNLWFDGWAMLKAGINSDKRKRQAAEAFVNYVSRPDNVVRNMYYIGYTSAISGGDDSTIFDYADWCYAAEDDAEDVVDYSLDYFFSNDKNSEDYIITADSDQLERQLFSQYPTEDVLERSVIMDYCGKDTTKSLNQMWINVRCYNPFRR